MPGMRSASTPRKHGRDFMRAYHSRAGGETVQSTSPAKSRLERCAAAAKSASEMVAPASHCAGLGQPADILQVVLDRAVADAERRRVRLAAAKQPLHELLAEQVARDFLGELAVEPGDQPARLDPLGMRPAEQRGVRIGFLQILADHARIGDGQPVLLEQCRDRAGRVQLQVFRAAAPTPSRASARTAGAFRRERGGPCGSTGERGRW